MYKKGIGSIFPNLEAEVAASRLSELQSYGARRRWTQPREELSFLCKGRVCLKPTGLEIGAVSGVASGAALAGP